MSEKIAKNLNPIPMGSEYVGTIPKPQIPSPHVGHSAAFGNTLNAKLAEFDGAIAALEGDMDGKARAYADGRKMDELLHADLARAKKAAEVALGALSDIERVQPLPELVGGEAAA